MNLPTRRPRLTSGMNAIPAIPSAWIVARNGASDASFVTSGTTIGRGSTASGVHGLWPSTARR